MGARCCASPRTRIAFLLTIATCLVALPLLAGAADSNPGGGYGSNSSHVLDWCSPLVVAEMIWIALVAIGFPIYSYFEGKRRDSSAKDKELRGLNLPRGSIRAILAMLVVGSFVILLMFGAPVLNDSYETTVAAFGALSGSIIGFYFGNRTATKNEDQAVPNGAKGESTQSQSSASSNRGDSLLGTQD